MSKVKICVGYDGGKTTSLDKEGLRLKTQEIGNRISSEMHLKSLITPCISYASSSSKNIILILNMTRTIYFNLEFVMQIVFLIYPACVFIMMYDVDDFENKDKYFLSYFRH